ncbi:hypothetical protein HRbin06_00276 [archaeon HR06]|nr:hypothetical protein HRbin06_00276 [archaeon HR06]
MEKILNNLQEVKDIINHALIIALRNKDVKELKEKIWKAHFKLEYSIALLKLKEDPLPFLDGRVERLDIKDALVEALDNIDLAINLIEKSKIGDAINRLRRARNNLKYIFSDLRKL